MAKETLLFFVSTLMTFVIIEGNHQSCGHHEDPNFAACLEKAANEYFLATDKDNGGIHHSQRSANRTLNNGPLKLNFNFNVTRYINSTRSTKLTLKYDADKKIMMGTLSAPHVGYESEIAIDGQFIGLRLLGQGVAIFHVYDVKGSYKVHLKPGEKDNLELEKVEFQIDSIKNAVIEILELSAPSKELEAAIRQVATQLSDALYEWGKSSWDEVIHYHYQELISEFLKNILKDHVVID